VINLSVDKSAVFAEIFRVLVPGGRIGITDVIADDDLTPAQRAERGNWVGCIAGALTFTEYRQGLEAAGFTHIEITPTHQVAEGMHSAIIQAIKPTTHTDTPATTQAPDSCCGIHACCTPTEHTTDPTTTVTQAKTAAGCGCPS
jgi:hypothetical protein